MRLRTRLLFFAAIAALAAMILLLAFLSLRSLLSEYGGQGKGLAYISLPLPLLLPLLLVPALSILMALLLTLRAIGKIKRREATERNLSGDGASSYPSERH